MDPEIRKHLEEQTKILKANNHMLKRMRRHQRLGSFFKVIYWALLLVVIFGGYVYVLQPVLSRLNAAYEDITVTLGGVQNTAESIGETGKDVTSFFGNLFENNN